MKQMNDTYFELDTRSGKRRLLPMVAFGCMILLSSAVMAEEPTTKDNDSIVMAIYGFLGTNYANSTTPTDDGFITDLGRSIYGKHNGTGYTGENVNVGSGTNSVDGTNRPN